MTDQPRRRRIRTGILLGGAAAVIAGGAFLMAQPPGSHDTARTSAMGMAKDHSVAEAGDKCQALHTTIQNDESFSPSDGSKCDKAEIAGGNGVTVSTTCQLINDRASKGNTEDMPAAIELTCHGEEQQALRLAGAVGIDSLCVGANIDRAAGKSLSAEVEGVCPPQ